jgi:hypothetical protein
MRLGSLVCPGVGRVAVIWLPRITENFIKVENVRRKK